MMVPAWSKHWCRGMFMGMFVWLLHERVVCVCVCVLDVGRG